MRRPVTILMILMGVISLAWLSPARGLFSPAVSPGESTPVEASPLFAQGMSNQTFPAVIQLPTGFRPEGIAVGRGTNFYVGSLAGGAIVRGDLRTGQTKILVPQQQGQVAVGLNVDTRTNRLFVAGGGTGMGTVYNADTGEQEASYTFATGDNVFINDVVATRDAAYFTNSSRSVLYKVPFGQSGRLPGQSAVQTLSLGGEFNAVQGFNTNGIDATANGKHLIIVNSTTGLLYTVDPASGDAREIDLDGETVTNGDGILLDGKTLYVVRNRQNQIAVIRLTSDLSSGKVTGTLTSPDFQVPTTIAQHGNNLYAVNAKFGADNADAIPYEVVKVAK